MRDFFFRWLDEPKNYPGLSRQVQSSSMRVDPMLNRPEWWLDWYNDGVACSESRDTWAAVYGWLESWRLFYEKQRRDRLENEAAS